MTLIQSLVNDAADSETHRLSSLLLRAKVLAVRLKSTAFLEWVTSELDGYDTADSVPSYRVIYPALLGGFSGAFGAATKNVVITLDDCPQEMRDFVCKFPVMGSCASIEAMLDSTSETHHRHFDAGLVGLVRQCTRIRVVGQELQSLQAMFTDTEVAGVLSAIRSRLLDFLLDLESNYPTLTGDSADGDAVPAADIDRLAKRYLHNGGTLVINTASVEMQMGDSYQVGQAGAVGRGAMASHMTFQQAWDSRPVDLDEISRELAELVEALKQDAKTPEQKEAVGVVMAAQAAAAQGDGPTTFKYIKKMGLWAVGVGEKIGAAVAARGIYDWLQTAGQ